MTDAITITIKGRIPSKKNSKFVITTKRGYSMPVSSGEFKKWERDAIRTIAYQRITEKVNEPIIQCAVRIEVIFPDLRQRDLSNVAEGIMDVLVSTGILADDNWRVVRHLELVAIGADKDNAGARIIIKKTGVKSENNNQEITECGHAECQQAGYERGVAEELQAAY